MLVKHFRMRLLIFALLFFVLGLANVNSQTKINIDSLQKQSKELIYIDPLKSIKISDYILQNAEDGLVKIMGILTKSENYFVQNDYNSSLKQLKKFNQLNINHEFWELKKQLLLIEISDSLNIQIDRAEILANIDERAESLKNPIQQNEIRVRTQFLNKSQDLNVLVQLENEIQSSSLADKSTVLNKIRLKIAKKYLEEKDLESAFHYYSKIDENVGSYFYYQAQIGKSKILKNQNQYDQSSKILLNLISERSKIKEVFLSDIYQNLAVNYLNQGKFKSYSFYQNLYLKAFEKNVESKQKARLMILDLIELEKTKHDSDSIKFYRKIIYGIGVFLVLVLGYFILKLIRIRHLVNQKTQEQKNKEWLETSKKEMEARWLEEKNTPFNIPEKTELVILNHLKKFEDNHQFLNSDLSLSSLAKEFNTNTSYLSEIINKHIGKNFKTYINELRIQYITQKLKENPEYLTYKISYLADEAGFTSRTSFTTIFKSVTGLSPSVFIESLQSNNKE